MLKPDHGRSPASTGEPGSARRRGATVVLVTGGLLVIGLIAVFALELANTQAKSRHDVIARVHERAVLAAALIDSLFNTLGQQIPQDERLYGGRVVTDRALDANVQQNLYLALVKPTGGVLASTPGFTPQARANLARSAALSLVRAGRPYGIGNDLPYGTSGVLNLAVAFPSYGGERILLTGIAPAALGALFSDELRKIPGVRGAHNYLIDGSNAVLASNNPAYPAGSHLNKPSQVAALRRATGDRNGHYYVVVPLANSTWRMVLAAPDATLFASVSGARKWIPWIIVIAFGLVAALALGLGRRLLASAESDLSRANSQLAAVNRELAISNAALEHRASELARSNADLDQFASIASHDLQEPLRKVRTFTEQLVATEGDQLSEKGRDYLRRANSAAERMQRLIQDLLAFSRVSTHGHSFAEVDLEEVAREVLEDLSLELEQAGAVVHLGSLPTISADALQMRQLLQNLISNAVKFRREGVTPEISLEATVEGDDMRLVVTDNGIGFDPKYAGRIFRVFERLHGRLDYPGTGIGLALCRKIAERHGGSILAESEPGVGSRFTVTLPVAHPEAAELSLYEHDAVSTTLDPKEGHVRA